MGNTYINTPISGIINNILTAIVATFERFSTCGKQPFMYNETNKTRQGYARERTLKPAGYLFLGAVL
jgi:hypothetical protein